MHKFFLPLLLLLSLADVTAQEKSFTRSALFGNLRARQIGPAVMSGRISTLAVAHDQPEVIYVGSAGGGVWKSVSGGASFRPVFDDHTQSIGKITIDPSDPETIWVGTGETWVRNSVSVGDGIYKSTNGGSQWRRLGLEDTERIADIIVHPTNSDIVYVAALGHLWDANEERGVFKTTDGGANWTKILYVDENTGAADLAIDPEDPDVLYAAMWSFRRLPWTFDSGFTGGSGLYKTTDGGNNWKKIQNGLPGEKLGRMAIAVAPSNRDILYLSVECKSKDLKGLYLSTDRGDSWSHVSDDFNATVRPFYFSNLVVDPKNDSIVMKVGLQMIISEDRGGSFRTMPQSVHSDVHDIWIDPNNTKHVLIGTDGGVYESVDRGRTFKMFGNLPVSQFYHVSVDDEQPFNVYGGLQDNGSWYGPSQKPGGIANRDWNFSFGGDGFYSFRHPREKDIIFSEYQGGQLVRYNKKTGQSKDIKPYPAESGKKFRFNWNTPLHLSPNGGDRLYFGAQYLFRSRDMGDRWEQISPDLTINDPEKQKQHLSGGLSIDNSTAENHCAIYAIAESYLDENTIWVGTDDGNLQVTNDGGQTWQNVTAKAPDLPANTWVTFIEPGRFDAKTAYVTFDGHRTGDLTPYLYKTNDGGRTWQSIVTPDISGYALSVRQDPVNADLLFLGTEFGLFISLDGGESWAKFENNVPAVGVRDMVIHPRENALVMATHGRGIIILDDITPLRQMSRKTADEDLYFFDTEATVLRDPGGGGGWYGGDGEFVGPNPSSAAQIVYYMRRRHTFGKMYIEVWKDGELLRTLPAGKSAGVNVVEMPTALEKPRSAPTNNRAALGGSLFGPNLPAGRYDVKLIQGKNTYETSFELVNDPQSVYSEEDRAVQLKTVMQLYQMTERVAYLYYSLGELHEKTDGIEAKKKKLQAAIDALAEKAKTTRNNLVALDGDFYVDESEQLRERISELYGQISGYPGRPSDSQLQRLEVLAGEMAKVEDQYKNMTEAELQAINEELEKAGVPVVGLVSFAGFLEDESLGGGGGGSQQLMKRAWQWYDRFGVTPLGLARLH